MSRAKNHWTVVTLALALCLGGALVAGAQVADTNIHSSDVVWNPTVDYSALVLTISGPKGVTTHHFAAGELPSLEAYDLDDGSYTWQLKALPVLDSELRAALAEANANGDRIGQPNKGLTQTGYLTVRGGAFLVTEGSEPQSGNDTPGAPAQKDQVIIDDLIVQGSICAGLDCSNGESFGFDTLRLKENNLRIKFQDTSVSASFPSNDWQLTANDTSNGGANKFSIDDIDGGRTPFTVEASAPSHSLYVDDGGRIGLGTSTPVVELHVVNGDSPTLRLEQDGSSGFTPQTWDVAGNETNYFVRDATNGSRLPFKIKPSAPTNSIYVDTDGDVGLGTASPSAGLDVIGNAEINDNDDGQTSTALTVRNTSNTANGRTMLQLSNLGSLRFRMENTQTTRTWEFEHRSNGAFAINLLSNGGDEFSIDTNGAATVSGNLTTNGALNVNFAGNFGGVGNFGGDVSAPNFITTSDVKQKTDFAPVDPQAVLDSVVAMPVSTWMFKAQPGVRHMGPMAQDFHAAFGLGIDERHISTTDSAGVALAAIQALDQQIDAKDAELAELRQQNANLEDRLAALEALVQSMAGNQ